MEVIPGEVLNIFTASSTEHGEVEIPAGESWHSLIVAGSVDSRLHQNCCFALPPLFAACVMENYYCTQCTVLLRQLIIMCLSVFPVYHALSSSAAYFYHAPLTLQTTPHITLQTHSFYHSRTHTTGPPNTVVAINWPIGCMYGMWKRKEEQTQYTNQLHLLISESWESASWPGLCPTAARQPRGKLATSWTLLQRLQRNHERSAAKDIWTDETVGAFPAWLTAAFECHSGTERPNQMGTAPLSASATLRVKSEKSLTK